MDKSVEEIVRDLEKRYEGKQGILMDKDWYDFFVRIGRNRDQTAEQVIMDALMGFYREHYAEANTPKARGENVDSQSSA